VFLVEFPQIAIELIPDLISTRMFAFQEVFTAFLLSLASGASSVSLIVDAVRRKSLSTDVTVADLEKVGQVR